MGESLLHVVRKVESREASMGREETCRESVLGKV